VGSADDFFGHETMLSGPLRPDTSDGRGGVDEDAIEIEEHTATLDFHGSMIPSFGVAFCVAAPRNQSKGVSGKAVPSAGPLASAKPI